jgi:hypothetical protein
VREIRTLRATGRGLETEPWRGLRHRQKAKAAGNSYSPLPVATAPALDPTAIVRSHKPQRLRQPDEPWSAFVERGGLDLLHRQFADGGRNPCAVETTLLYHADILGRLGDETPDWQVARRQQVTRHVLGRIFESKQHGSP